MNAPLAANRDETDWDDETPSERDELRQFDVPEADEPDGEPISPRPAGPRAVSRPGLLLVCTILPIACVVAGLALRDQAGRATFAIGSDHQHLVRLATKSAGVMLLLAAQSLAAFLVLPRVGGPKMFDRLLGLLTGIGALVAGCVAAVLGLAA